MRPEIQITGITKDYGSQKGVFDISFTVNRGEVFGFLGPNGAGKTTTIRQLLGFIKPDRGQVRIRGLDCFKDAAKIQHFLGYLPGETAFMDDMTGTEFIRFTAGMKRLKNLASADPLIDRFDLDPSGKIKKMSKGMKQKIAIVCAFMADPEILILDEPTSGLDPLMQNRFIDLILEEKQRGKTILMSSHLFEEVERTCDRTAIIRQGQIVDISDKETLSLAKQRIFEITFRDPKSAASYATAHPGSTLVEMTVTLTHAAEIDPFIKELSNYPVRDLKIRTQTLEELFMHYYGGTSHAK